MAGRAHTATPCYNNSSSQKRAPCVAYSSRFELDPQHAHTYVPNANETKSPKLFTLDEGECKFVFGLRMRRISPTFSSSRTLSNNNVVCTFIFSETINVYIFFGLLFRSALPNQKYNKPKCRISWKEFFFSLYLCLFWLICLFIFLCEKLTFQNYKYIFAKRAFQRLYTIQCSSTRRRKKKQLLAYPFEYVHELTKKILYE